MENRLSELRRAVGLSQGGLADLVGVSRQTINNLERGRYDPSFALAVRIARIFNLPSEEVFLLADAVDAS